MKCWMKIVFLPIAFLVMWITSINAQQHQVLYRGNDERNVNFVRHIRTFLDVTPFLREKVEDLMSCVFSCLQHAACLSFNMAVKPFENMYDCLLLATDMYNSSENLQSSNDFNHHSIQSPCESSPCQNGGSCHPVYETKEYKCECAAGFFGINCENYASSCSDIQKQYPSSVNGNYEIDPDGVGGVTPFTVFCDMNDKGGEGVTVISHDSEDRTVVNGFEEPGSYSRKVTYTGASLDQLSALTELSKHCEQFIKYECYNANIRIPNGSWLVSRDGTKMNYWGGSSPGSGKCACGMTNSCANSERPCNCDKNDDEWQEDSGLLTYKSDLPVSELRFGDTGAERERGFHTLGKLKCYGLGHQFNLNGSVILGGHPDYDEKLEEYLTPVQVSGKQWKLCFRASEHKYSSAAFHAACDNKGPTVTLVRVGIYAFGGYSDKSWNGDDGWINSTAAFLFSLKNHLNEQHKMPIYKNPENAMYSNNSNGPIFGLGKDLLVADSCNVNTNSSARLGATYRPPNGYAQGSTEANNLLAGSHQFKCDEYEVFYQE